MLDVMIDPGGWATDVDWAALATGAARAAIAETPHGPMLDGPAYYELSVKLSDDAEVQRLNAAYRGKDKPTNVLSFPAPDMPVPEAEATPLGDIALACETVSREAAEQGKSLADHTTHLIVHGTLHLLGYDHETDGEAEEMESEERKILARLGIADPYES